MSYTALYRKFRPDNFEEVVGQDHVVRALRNQITSGRIGHAYLFTGSRGTGKTSVAKIFARAVNCENPKDGSPCNECAACRGIADGSALNVIEIDAASNNGVDNIRQIRDEVAYSPTQGKYKVYIIDEVHMLSTGAFNALLKTLEEPPSYVIFILATTEVQKIPVTILSRCQRYDFHRLSQETITERLDDLLKRENVDADEKAVRFIARKADGGMRDALSLADECISFYLGETLTYEKVLKVLGSVDTEEYSRMLREVIDGNVAGVLRHLEDMLYRGADISSLTGDFIWYLRNLLLYKASEQAEEMMELSAENLKLIQEEAGMISENALMRYIRVLSDLLSRMRFAVNKRVLAETALIKLCRPQMETDDSSLLERIRQLEKKLESGVVVAASAGTPPGNFQPAAAPAGTANVPAGEQAAASAATVVDPGINWPKAAPADLQNIKAAWSSILSGLNRPRLRTVAANVDLKFNPAQGQEDQLFVVFPDFQGETFTKNPDEPAAALEEAIAEKTGKRARVRLLLAAEESVAKEKLMNIEVEQSLKAHVDFDVDYVDDDDEV